MLRRANGTFEGDIDDYIENHFIQDQVTDKIFRLPDTRSIRVVNRFMDNGGWVSIHEDVTERERTEDELAAPGHSCTDLGQHPGERAGQERQRSALRSGQQIRREAVGTAAGAAAREDGAGHSTAARHGRGGNRQDQKVLQTRQAFSAPEQAIKTPSGSPIVRATKVPILDDDGTPQFVLT